MKFAEIEKKARNKKEKKIVEKRWEEVSKEIATEEDGLFSLRYLSITLMVLGLISFIMTYSIDDIIRGVFLVVAIVGVILFLYSKRYVKKIVEYKKIEVEPSLLVPSMTLPVYLREEIDQMYERLVGKDSRYQVFLNEVTDVNQEARKALEAVKYRLNSNKAVYLQQAMKNASEVVERTEKLTGSLRNFKAKVDVFISECKKAVCALEGPLDDLELVRKIASLSHKSNNLEGQAEQVIAGAVTDLQQFMSSTRLKIETKFESVGVVIAAESVSSDNLLAGLLQMEKTIAEFVPARLFEKSKQPKAFEIDQTV